MPIDNTAAGENIGTTTKRKHVRKSGSTRNRSTRNRSTVSTGGGTAAQMAMTPYIYDEEQLMTYQALNHNSDVARSARQRFTDGVRATLPNGGKDWTETDRGFNPPKAHTR